MKTILTESEKELGKLIREYRELAEFSQKQIADRLGLSNPVFISQIENGGSRIPHFTLGEFMAILNIPPKKVFYLLRKIHDERVLREVLRGRNSRG